MWITSEELIENYVYKKHTAGTQVITQCLPVTHGNREACIQAGIAVYSVYF